MIKPTPTPKPNPTPKTLPSPLPSSTAFRANLADIEDFSGDRSTKKARLHRPRGGSPIQVVSQTSTWSDFKQRVRYWILLAQLNPIPVAIGAAVLLFLIGLLILQRRRARASRRARLRKPPKRVPSVSGRS
jgi:hypothetical protein